MTATMTAKQEREADKANAIETLRKLCPPGTTVYTVLRHVSASGMSRRIDCYVIEDNKPRWITGYVKTALGMPRGKFDAATVTGCGMDMGFHLVYNLSRTLWHSNFTCIGQGCRSNDHSNGDRDYTPHLHSDGGYALKHEWM